MCIRKLENKGNRIFVSEKKYKEDNKKINMELIHNPEKIKYI